jgi:hypothetical protein
MAVTDPGTFARPVDVVFDIVADERNLPKYYPDLLPSEMVTDGPIGVGTKFTAVHNARRRPCPPTPSGRLHGANTSSQTPPPPERTDGLIACPRSGTSSPAWARRSPRWSPAHR